MKKKPKVDLDKYRRQMEWHKSLIHQDHEDTDGIDLIVGLCIVGIVCMFIFIVVY